VAFASSENDADDLENGILDFAYRTYVHLLIVARLGNGTWTEDQELSSFHILMPVDGRVSIRVNGEHHAWSIARAKRSASEGDILAPEDFAVDRLPLLDDASDIPYLRAWRRGEKWIVDYSFAFAHPRRIEHLDAAAEFIRAATSAQEDELTRPFVENALHAAEHLARAELLCYPPTVVATLGARKHGTLWAIYNSWAKLENTEQRYADLLNRVADLRPRATYLQGDFVLSTEDMKSMLATLFAWQWWVTSVVHEGAGVNPIKVVATREIPAGTVVTTDDYTIWPPKKPH
jgi:hypothetical protein